MRLTLIFSLSGAILTSAVGASLDGPTSARYGRQNIYRVLGPEPNASYRWHLTSVARDGLVSEWEGNDDRPALNLTFIGNPGRHRLWLISAEGASAPLEIDTNDNRGTQNTSTSSAAKSPTSEEILPAMTSESLAKFGAATDFARTPIPSLPGPITPRSTRDSPSPSVVIIPDAGGIVDLAGRGVTPTTAIDANPFRVRYQPKLVVREIALTVASVLIGAEAGTASAISNGKLYNPGDSFESLVVSQISTEGIELQVPPFAIQIPATDRTVTLRIPR